MNSPTVRLISDCFVKPKFFLEESSNRIQLSPWDLAMLSVHYIQKGLLFRKPTPSSVAGKNSMDELLENLKDSLSVALIHFYPLAGRLATVKREEQPLYTVHIDVENSPGARFIYAVSEMTIAEIVSPVDVPVVVQSFFDHDKAINHDGHNASLLSVQVTELIDGVFIGCSINHMVADGTSFWHFFNAYSEIFKAKERQISISRPPIHDHWFPDGCAPVINLPFTHSDQFISRHEAPKLRERFFHFSPEFLAKLKSKANSECSTNKISTLQAISAFVWRHVTTIRRLPPNQMTTCRMACNNRGRLDPPLSPNYFGNSIQTVSATTTAGELLSHSLGWAAQRLHQAVASHTDEMVRNWIDSWLKSPLIYQLEKFFDPCSIMMGSSPRFDMYGNEFGLGRAVAIRSGYANKFDGKISLYPGTEGGGSMDLEVCLSLENMSALEADEEFMEAVSASNLMY